MKEKTNSVAAQAVTKKKPLRFGITTTLVRRIAAALLCFTVAMLAAGAEAFPGTFPFGIAVISAATGAAALIPALAGALIGSVRIGAAGGAHALILTLLSVTRILASVWLMSDRLPEWMRSRDKRRRMLRKLDEVSGRSEQSARPAEALRHAALLAGNVDGTMLRESVIVRMALSACAALFAGAWSVVKGGFAYFDLFGAVFTLLFTPLVTYLIYAATDRNMRASPFRETGIYTMCALVTHSLNTFVSGASAFNAGVMFAFAATLTAANAYGVHRGALAGICCGMVMDLRFMPLYALGAVISAPLSRCSQTFGILSAGIAAVAWAIYQAGLDGLVAVMPPVVAACAALIPLYRYGLVRLPADLFGPPPLSADRGDGMSEMARDELSRRVGQMSDSLTSVSTILYGMSEKLSKPGRGELREICESAFGMYCRGCAVRTKCHEARSPKTASAISEMTNELFRDGVASAAAIPASLASHCFNIGRIIDEINLTAGSRIARMKANDKLSVAAADYELCGELMKTAYEEGERVAEIDADLSKKLRRLLVYNDFRAASVTAYGGRIKHIYVHDVDLMATRMGGDDIRRLFEGIAGQRLSQPEFKLDGAVLSMSLHSVYSFACASGRATCAASSVHKYYGDTRSCGADCTAAADGAGEGINSAGDDLGMAELCRENYKVEEIADYGDDEIDEIKADESEPEVQHGRVRISVTDSPTMAGEVCGDVIISFESAGKYYMLISDGMGSGREAALTSGVCATLFRRLIESGAGLETSLKMLNGIIRAGERECSATVDIAEIDLISGEARFIKSGAAPSFILRDGSIFRLQSKTIPIGIIRALDAEMIKFDVQAGDRVVMVSDGAARSYDEVPWLLEMMSSDETVLRGSPREAAERIVHEAARRGSSDDITAGVICIMGRMA